MRHLVRLRNIRPATVACSRLNAPCEPPIRSSDDYQAKLPDANTTADADRDMSDPISNEDQLDAAEHAIRKIGSDPWFADLTPDWQRFLVSHTVETFGRYEVTMEQAAQKLIEFYVEITLDYPEAKSMNPWEARLTAEGTAAPGDS